MAKLNIAAFLTGLEATLKAVNEMMPVAQKFGVPAIVANISTIAIAAIAVGHNILERAANVKDVLSEQDEGKLRAMLADLQRVNDTLAGVISEEAEAVASGEAPTGVAGANTGG